MIESELGQGETQRPGVLLWGGKGKARVVEEMLRESGVGIVQVIFDTTLQVPEFATSAFFTSDIATLKERLGTVSHFVVCMGGDHGFARLKTAGYLERIGLQPLSVVHERSFVEPTSSLGQGCQVMPCAVVHKFVSIGDHTVINTSATIDHECVIGSGVHVMGSAAVAGRVEIGDYATIGTNATVLPFLKIGEGAYVGAGAVVTKNVEPYTVVAGVPARVLRKQTLQFNEDILLELVT